MAVALFLFVNWLVYFVFSLVLPPILALLAIFGLYYAAARVAVRYFAFPGSFYRSRRGLEWQHCQSLANDMGRSIMHFKGMTQYMLSMTASGHSGNPVILDHDKSI